MSLKGFRPSERPQVQMAYAAAWEALIGVHSSQAHLFVQEFASRLPVLDALDLYFRVVPVPEPMIEPARVRALVSIDLDSLPPRGSLPTVAGWQWLRLDVVSDVLHFRREYNRRTTMLARMVGARAAEAVLATHVENAVEFARLLRRLMPAERAIAHYVREFTLSPPAAQSVSQRAKAELAGEALAAQYTAPAWQPPAEAPAPAPLPYAARST
jgi:hypothetical protein